MKLLIIILFTCFIALSQQKLSSKQLDEIRNVCLKEVGMNGNKVDAYTKTLIFPRRDITYMNFLACIYKKQGYQTETGEILYDNIHKFLLDFYSRSEVNAVINPCRGTSGNTHGESAFYAMTCVIENIKTIEKNQNDNNEV